MADCPLKTYYSDKLLADASPLKAANLDNLQTVRQCPLKALMYGNDQRIFLLKLIDTPQS